MASRELLSRATLIALVALLLAPRAAGGAGPWNGRIIDRESAQPIAGAVVLAVWTVRSWAEIHPHDEFHSAVETVSDADGRFVIPEHTARPTKPLTGIHGPQLIIFKAGFGPWEFEGSPYYGVGEDSSTRDERIKQSWRAFEREGAVFQLRRYTEHRQRSSWLGRVRPLSVPDDQIPRLLEALDAEARALDLSPARDPRRGGQR
jgi:hypothetical protein